MKHVVAFSGGRTSAYMSQLLKSKYDNVEFFFIDTGAEHPKTYEFIRKCDKAFNLNLTVLRPVINQTKGVGTSYDIVSTDDIGWDLSIMKDLTKKYGTFTAVTPLCTSTLKRDVADKYIKTKGDVTRWIGIRCDEKRRLKDKTGFKYLADISDMEKSDILEWWSNMPFDLNIEEHLGNCIFCVKKGNNRIALAQRDEPELFEEWVDMVKQARQRGEQPKELIYRGKVSPEGVVKFYEDYTYDEIKQTMRMYKNKQTLCSESCESFQMELFNEGS